MLNSLLTHIANQPITLAVEHCILARRHGEDDLLKVKVSIRKLKKKELK